MSKGSNPRPVEDQDAFNANFERIFGCSPDDIPEPETTGQVPVVEGDDVSRETKVIPK